MRVMFYLMTTCGYLDPCQFLVPVVSIWPAVLTCYHGNTAGPWEGGDGARKPASLEGEVLGGKGGMASPLLMVLQHVVTGKLSGQPSELHNKVIFTIHRNSVVLGFLLQRLSQCFA